MWIVACRATTLLNRAMNGAGPVRHNFVVATDAESLWREFQLSGILCFMSAVTKSTQSHIGRRVLVFMLRQVCVAASTQLTTAGCVAKLMLAGLIGDMTGGTKLLARATIMRA